MAKKKKKTPRTKKVQGRVSNYYESSARNQRQLKKGRGSKSSPRPGPGQYSR